MRKRFIQYLTIGSLSVSVLIASVATSIANIVLPAISSSFGVSFSVVRWVVLSYLIATTIFSLVVGRIGDLKGRRKVLLYSMVLFVVGTLLSASAFSFSALIVARIFQGVGGAALIVLPLAIVTEKVAKENTGRVVGLFATMSAVGTASGPSIGGFLSGGYGWRAPFFLVAVLGFINILFLLTLDRNEESSSVVKKESHAPVEALHLLSMDPLLRIRLASNLTVSAVMMSTLISGPFYLTHVLKLSDAHMGLVMSAGPITSVFFGLLSGWFVDRFGFLSVLKVGFIQLVIGSLCFTFLPLFFGAVGFAVSAISLSFGYQLFLSANSSCIMKNLASDERGLVSGALSLSRNLGLMIGTFVMGGLFESFGLQVTFYVAALLVIFLFFIQINIQKRRNNGT